MRFDTRTLPLVGLLATWVVGRYNYHHGSPTGHTRRWAYRGADGGCPW